MPSKSARRGAWVLGAFLFAGCAGLLLQKGTVRFQDPYATLGIVPAEPTLKEKAGILLRLNPDFSGPVRSVEELTLFASIKEGKGVHFDLRLRRTDRFESGSRKDSYVLRSETVFEGDGGRLIEEVELTGRGEMTGFIRGSHDSKIGKFEITDWKRTPLFPEGPVTVGESWDYEEVMSVRMRSRWIREMDPQPYRIHAVSRLTGFALLGEVRCAVIETRATQTKREHFKVLFKELIFDMVTEITENSYLDYARGIVLARIARHQSYMRGINVPLAEEGRSQSVYRVES
jgi:hypothetical protein